MTHNVNGLDALGSVARSDFLSRLPAVIIVDLNMPVLDGGRFLAFLRADMQLRAVPAVVLDHLDRKTGPRAGAGLGGQRGVFQAQFSIQTVDTPGKFWIDDRAARSFRAWAVCVTPRSCILL